MAVGAKGTSGRLAGVLAPAILPGRRAAVLASFAALCLAGLVFSGGAQAAGASLKAWGSDYYGQIGDGTTGVEAQPTPGTTQGIATATEVAAGQSVLALLTNGTVMSWGLGYYGQLGDGGTANRALPAPVPGLTDVVAVASGSTHSLALLANGTVMSWGHNTSGQLGSGDPTGPESCAGSACRKTPAPVPGLANVVAISAAQNSSLALLADGTVVAWGLNSAGETGDGAGSVGGCECVPSPRPVPGLGGAVAISAGTLGGSALLADGTVKAWGFNGDGELGIGTSTGNPGCECLGPVTVPGLTGIRSVASGGRHSLAILPGGGLVAWGSNNAGELGIGTVSESGCYCVPQPTPLAGLGGVRAAIGNQYTSLILLDSGVALTAGLGKGGQIGNGSTKDQPSPTPVTGVAGASGVGGVGSTYFVLIGPSQSLGVGFAGASTGNVGTSGLVCASACAQSFPQGQVKILRAEPAANFAGWTGACTGTGPCQVRLDSDQGVTATFGAPKGTAITKATIKPKKKRATFSFTAPGALSGYQCQIVKPKPKKQAKGKSGKAGASAKAKKKKKRKSRWSACASGKTYKKLKPGRYTFKVRALNALGADPNPALKKFSLKAPKKKPGRGGSGSAS